MGASLGAVTGLRESVGLTPSSGSSSSDSALVRDKSYKLEFIPEWWPDVVDFVSFVGPSNAPKIQNEAILQAMYASVGLDINTYHDRDDSPVREKKKTKKTVKAPVENETDNMDSDDLGEEM